MRSRQATTCFAVAEFLAMACSGASAATSWSAVVSWSVTSRRNRVWSPRQARISSPLIRTSRREPGPGLLNCSASTSVRSGTRAPRASWNVRSRAVVGAYTRVPVEILEGGDDLRCDSVSGCRRSARGRCDPPHGYGAGGLAQQADGGRYDVVADLIRGAADPLDQGRESGRRALGRSAASLILSVDHASRRLIVRQERGHRQDVDTDLLELSWAVTESNRSSIGCYKTAT
ncbi:hypothetical protein [Streptomyces sp. NPDC001296]